MIFNPEEYSSLNHACTLKTIIAIEQFIRDNSGLYSKTELWNGLPKKIMYQSYKLVLEYLLFINKISIENKKIVWVSSSSGLNLIDFESQNHNCTLSTVIFVFNFISSNSGQYSRTELWANLPKKIMYQSYKVLLAYLLDSNLISLEKKKVTLKRGRKQ